MAHVFEEATSSRSKCRGCSQPIAKGAVRFGERLPNAFGEGEMTLWYHPLCAAYRRPEAVMEALKEDASAVDELALQEACNASIAGPRLRRIGSLEKAPSGRARCRACRELIEKDWWRVPLIFFEDGMFAASGFVHVSCLPDYCEGAEVRTILMHFAGDVGDADRSDVERLLKKP